ncbi:hypothetical protein SAM23877_0302 [Streptomyces ambofaciens ATCC 23877]|uniref:Signal transduction histidine kinase subgroup 3 dimerisation and phosphoacceptor domain-containing protein n=1 Tax=Streptomyces ambofaciens (strain ATCC 23877 / 3486 / DSM 40053 / JCM 4204 / NBRC 12836 / NRRL B-2516) TaxID=278992 RepID=A0A0K2AKA9_STRA7|nr:hypothetical protein SAM23877_0302 [Streptomyces ambofaciens ATCC 23877]
MAGSAGTSRALGDGEDGHRRRLATAPGRVRARDPRAAVHARQRTEQQELRAERQLLAARAAERTTIARELHDRVAHHVTSMVLRVGVARIRCSRPEPAVSSSRTPHQASSWTPYAGSPTERPPSAGTSLTASQYRRP